MMSMEQPKTYAEALSMGYRVVDKRVQAIRYNNRAIYVSAEERLEDAPIQVGLGKRKGWLFVWHNDRGNPGYTARLYLSRDESN